MYHNTIESPCITKEATPLSYAMFHNMVIGNKRDRVVMTPAEMQNILFLNNLEREIPEDWESIKETIDKVLPNCRFHGFVGREDTHSIQLWHDRITIYKPNTNGMFGDKYALCRINWSAIGACTIEESKLFSEIMKEAVYIAEQIDKKFLAELPDEKKA